MSNTARTISFLETRIQYLKKDTSAYGQGALQELVSAVRDIKEAQTKDDTTLAEAGKALRAWVRFAHHLETREHTVPLWAALLNEEAVSLTNVVLEAWPEEQK